MFSCFITWMDTKFVLVYLTKKAYKSFLSLLGIDVFENMIFIKTNKCLFLKKNSSRIYAHWKAWNKYFFTLKAHVIISFIKKLFCFINYKFSDQKTWQNIWKNKILFNLKPPNLKSPAYWLCVSVLVLLKRILSYIKTFIFIVAFSEFISFISHYSEFYSVFIRKLPFYKF